MTIKELLQKLNIILEDVQDYAVEYKDNLLEHAAGKSELNKMLRDKSDIIIEHLIKGVQYGSQYDSTLHHWAKEIFGNLQKLVYKRYKGKNKNQPTAQDLKDCLLDYGYDNVDAISAANEMAKYSDTQSKEGCYKNPKYDDVNELYSIIKQMMRDLINLIVNKQFTIDNVEQLLREYANKR